MWKIILIYDHVFRKDFKLTLALSTSVFQLALGSWDKFLCLEYLIAWIPGKYKIFIHVIKNWKFIFTVLWVALFIRENDFSKYLNSIELCHKTYLLTLLFWKANQIHSGTIHFRYNLNLGAEKSYPKLYHSIFCIPA